MSTLTLFCKAVCVRPTKMLSKTWTCAPGGLDKESEHDSLCVLLYLLLNWKNFSIVLVAIEINEALKQPSPILRNLKKCYCVSYYDTTVQFASHASD